MSCVEPIGGPTCLLTKICSKCGVEDALEAFSRSRASKDGRRSECKSCFAEYSRKYHEKNREKVRAAKRKYNEENRESVAAASRKYYEENREKVRAAKRKYNEENREKVRAAKRKYNEENRESVAAASRKYYEENRESVAAASRKYYEENRESVAAARRKYYEENREKVRAQKADYCRANPHIINAKGAKRRAAKLRQTPAWVTATENEEIKKLYQLAGNLSASTGVLHHVDHIRPLQGRKIAGLHCLLNLQVISATQNLKKTNRFKPGSYPYPCCLLHG
jgi:hypothetical protein